MFQAQRPKLSPLRRIIVTVPILIGLLISLLIGTTQSAAFASSETATSKEIITGLFPIRARMEKDHRIRVNEEKLHQEPRVHVYLVLSDQKLPYTVSLGWLKVIKAPDSLGKEEEKKSLFGKTLSVSNPFKKHEDLLNPSKKDAKSLAVIDENGFIVPSPGFQTGQKDFRKVDYRGLIAFEYLMDGNLTKARKEYGQTVKDGPADPKFHNNLGALLALNGDYKQASEQFDQSLKSKSDYGVALANRALLFLALGHPDLALNDAKKSLTLDPGLLAAKIAHVRGLIETGDTKTALSIASQMKAKSPGEWQALLVLADAQIAAKELEAARETLKRLTVLSPNNHDLLLKLAQTEEKGGDLDEAIKRARKATLVGGQDPRTHILLAKYLEANQDLNAATLQLERAMELNPDKQLRKTAMGAMLRILVARQMLEDAEAVSKKWAKTYSRDSASHYNRAWILSQLDGQEYTSEAIKEYEEALSLDPALASAHYNLGLLYVKTNQNKKALACLKTFLKNAPCDKDRKQASELIEKLTGN